MWCSISIQRRCAVTGPLLFLVLTTVFLLPGVGIVAAEAFETNPPELKLSLRDAIQAAIDNTVTGRLLKEPIAAAQAQAHTSFGALLPNVSEYVSRRSQTVNLGAILVRSSVTPSRSCKAIGSWWLWRRTSASI
jgi:hypothetical protein